MQVIRDIANITNTQPLICVLGNFDGVHQGHRSLLTTAKEIAECQGYELAVMTFEPHPAVFFGRAANIRIISAEEKLQLLADMGVNQVMLLEFNEMLANIPAEVFLLDVLLARLNVKHIVIGHDFIFGKDRSGNAEFLRDMANKHNFTFTQIEPKTNNKYNLIYSSSEIRKAIAAGNIKLANELMGREFSIKGEVTSGIQMGSKLGFPTANLSLKDYIRPKYGVYVVRIKIDDKSYDAVANIGIRPTISNDDTPVLEVHIFDFDDEIRSKQVTVYFVDYIREEKKFATLEELIKQIAKDCQQARKILTELRAH